MLNNCPVCNSLNNIHLIRVMPALINGDHQLNENLETKVDQFEIVDYLVIPQWDRELLSFKEYYFCKSCSSYFRINKDMSIGSKIHDEDGIQIEHTAIYEIMIDILSKEKRIISENLFKNYIHPEEPIYHEKDKYEYFNLSDFFREGWQFDYDLGEFYTQKKIDFEYINSEIKNNLKNVDSDIDESLIKDLNNCLPDDKVFEKKTKNNLRQFFTDIDEEVLDYVNRAFMLFKIMEEKDFPLDWSAPMIYLSKAIELHLNKLLKPLIEGLSNSNHGNGLSSYENILRKNIIRIKDYYKIDDDNSIKNLIKSTNIFRIKYRNGYTHSEIMSKEILVELFKFCYKSKIFSNFKCIQ